MSGDFSDLLIEVRRIVHETAKGIFEELRREAHNTHPELEDIPVIASDFTLRGGKRLRAFLVLVGYWSREWGKSIDEVKYLMTGIEFLQSYLLVHDDIMDRDEVRRGGPTVHVWFTSRCREKSLLGDCSHYGISQAIVVGDYLESMAVSTFSKLELPANAMTKLIQSYTRGLRIVSYGQYMDLMLSMKPLREVDEADVLLVHKLKTASYTVELPLHLGAIASCKYSDNLLHELTSYAIPAGIAFQLRDDLLGLFGDPSITGKPVGSDVREKKKTLLVIKAYKEAPPPYKEFLEEVYDHKEPSEISDRDIAEVQHIVRDYGGYSYVVKLMKKYAEEAEKALREATMINDDAKKALKWLLRLFIYRKK